jgi:uncharacterized protein YkwD
MWGWLAVCCAIVWATPLPHPERSEGPAAHVSKMAEHIPRFARDEEKRPDWARLARAIHDETNAVRRNPAAYATHLERLLPRFDGTLLERPGRPWLRTEEGARAVREAIAALKSRRPMPPLRWSKGLAAAAADHVRDQGPTGGLEHRGTDGSSPATRASRYGRWIVGMAENIAYGDNPAREVVIQLLVDDGVPDRGHRKNILNPDWGTEGIACGAHREYGQICVMDLAVRYEERNSGAR